MLIALGEYSMLFGCGQDGGHIFFRQGNEGVEGTNHVGKGACRF